MSIANSVRNHLHDNVERFELIRHPHSACSSESAQNAHVSGHAVAKGIVLKDNAGYVLAVVPAEYLLDLEAVNRILGRHLVLALESDLAALFPDCEQGAVPAVGPAYGLFTIVENSLFDLAYLYFEGGDHETLVGVNDRAFRRMMRGAERGRISHRRH